MTLFLSFVMATVLTMMAIPPLIRSAQHLQFIDLPDDYRKIHSTEIPRVGGIAIYIGTLVPLLMFATLYQEVISLLIGLTIIFIFGVWDDRSDLDYRLKFLGQIMATLTVMLFGGVMIENATFTGEESLPAYIAYPLTLFFILGVTNAINLSDGLDGLAGGISLLTLTGISILAYTTDQMMVALISLAIIGAVLGFLRFNTHPARVFMGDCGSQFLGFSAAVLAIILVQDADTPFSTALPLLLLGVPIFDTLMVMCQRLYTGRSPFSPDRNHLHHRLMDLGFDHFEAVFIIYVAHAVLVLAAYYLCFYSDLLIISLYFLFCIVVLIFINRIAPQRWLPVSSTSSVNMKSEESPADKKGQRLLKPLIQFASLSIPVFILHCILTSHEISIDIGVLSLVMVMLLFLFYPRNRKRPLGWIERGAFYILGALVVYLFYSELLLIGGGSTPLHDLFFIALAFAVVAGFAYSPDKRFEMTPLDFIVIFATLAVPGLLVTDASNTYIAEGVVKLMILFYGIELVLNNLDRFRDSWRFFLSLAYMMLGVKSFV